MNTGGCNHEWISEVLPLRALSNLGESTHHSTHHSFRFVGWRQEYLSMVKCPLMSDIALLFLEYQ